MTNRFDEQNAGISVAFSICHFDIGDQLCLEARRDLPPLAHQRLDLNTARHLFTLICAVSARCQPVDESKGELHSVLFVCLTYSMGSPIAVALARQAFLGRIMARSVGVAAVPALRIRAA